MRCWVAWLIRLGEPLDGKGPIDATEFRRVEMVAPGVIARQSVHEPMYTGLKAIDAMTPVGRGQRELIIGDRQIGKTAICVDAIINQKDTDVYCIYVAWVRKNPPWPRWWMSWKKTGPWNTPRSLRPVPVTRPHCSIIAPYSGCAMGEYYRDNGKHALIIYDDLSKQAAAYRQVSLLLETSSRT